MDDGPGIEAADGERIFERLVRLDTARTVTGHGGESGLGLTTARGIARAHGGDLVLVPSAAGADFLLTLPTHPD